MGRKNIVKSFKILDAESLSSNVTSSATNVINLDSASIHLVWSSGSSPVGDITIEARNGDDNPWRTLDFGSTAISISGASGEHELNLLEMPFTSIRVVYTRTSGDATLDAIFTAKTEGA